MKTPMEIKLITTIMIWETGSLAIDPQQVISQYLLSLVLHGTRPHVWSIQ